MRIGAAPPARAGMRYRTRTLLEDAARSAVRQRDRARSCRACVQSLEPRMLLAGELYISELMASNTAALADVDDQFSDWIEIHNAGSTPLSLDGYYLTDRADNLDKWRFPAVSIGAGEYLVVFASGKDRAVAGQELHTDFSLDADGEYLALVEPDGLTIVSEFAPAFPRQWADISYGVDPAAGGALRYFATPSPRQANARAEVVINEIHYNPDVKTQLVEFIELHNPGSVPVDLSGASFTNGIDYTFPPGTMLPAGGYLLVSQNPTHFQQKFGRSAFGPWTGVLSNEGETIELRNRSGGQLDQVDYGLGFPWPTVGDAPGYSIELIHPDLDNSKGGNWRSFAPSGPGTNVTLFSSGGNWHFRKGTSEASWPDKTAWREPDFVEDGTWYSGNGPIGYDGNNAFSGSTQLDDMRSLYTTVFMRKTFYVADPSQFATWYIEAMYDDGFNAWINGHWIANAQTAGENLDYDDTADNPARESNAYDRFNITKVDPSTALRAGWNVIAVQFFNINKGGSSDAFFDARLIATSGGGNSPTPGRKNSVFATNAPPVMRKVSHEPNEPLAGQPVTITATITDEQGVASVSLSYQLVRPGNYFSKDDPAYSNPSNWTSLAMNDAGINGDAVAGDGVYTGVVPAAVQIHRGLVRYRITATDALGASVTAPYADDPQPNFAYFVYNGVPTWTGAVRPGSTPDVTYDFEAMPALPVYHLITTRTNHVESQYIPNSQAGAYGGDSYLWAGTLVYDGVVYDHIHFRARGGVWRYAMGKNMWKFDFNRGHEFQARDQYGRKLDTTWKKLNLGANIQQGDFGYRGEQGLFEYVGFKLFNLAGVPASLTTPVHFRIIENESETNNTTSQYDDDFQGLYLAIEQLDGRFLDQHDLPDGNLYKMEYGVGGGESNNQGPTQPSDNSDLVAFTRYGSTEQWWRDNVDLESYYSYRAIVEAIHHGDIGYGKNYFYYHNPETGKWMQLPWDLDLTWAESMFGNGNEPFKTRVLYTDHYYSDVRDPFITEYRNRLREILDLLWTPEQIGQMIDEYVAMVDVPGASMVDADRAMWDFNPILASSYVNPSKAGQGRFYQRAADRTFRGMAQLMKDYVSYTLTNTRNWMSDPPNGPSLLSLAYDPDTPGKPSATYIGPAGYPINNLQFRSSDFVSNGGNFAAIKWRIAEVTPASAPAYDPNNPRKYEITADWESDEITTFDRYITIPPEHLRVGATYRVRVRMKDDTGKWSNWSNAVQFVAGPASNASVKDALRITELNYDPAPPPPESGLSNEDFEFIELKNTGTQTINLLNVRFTEGIEFQFTEQFLAPGQSVLVVGNLGAFMTRYYTPGMNIAGQFADGRLNNAGERIKLVDASGQTIQDFSYAGTWFPSAYGGGDTIVAIDPLASDAILSTHQGWRPSRLPGGTPGADETDLPDGSIVINEAMTHTDGALGDWIELYNDGPDSIDLSGWWLSDDPGNPWKYQIQPGTVIGKNGFEVFTQFAHFGNPNGPGVMTPFALSELGGDEIVLSSATSAGVLTGLRIRQRLETAREETTLGRYVTSTGDVDFALMSQPTMGLPNADPLVGPVVINEIMYRPADGGDEFIELRNITDQPVMLYDPLHPANGWRFEQGISYMFEQVTLAAHEYVLVVPIDPEDFRAKYNVPESIRIFGPYLGNLNDLDEKVALAAPSDPEGHPAAPYYIVDGVHYYSAAPWPTAAAGLGASLGRKMPGQYANDVANWAAIASGGTPGLDNFDSTAPTATLSPLLEGSITITFSEPVTGFDLAALALTRNASALPLSADMLVSVDAVTWTLVLDALTWVEGDYALSLDPAGIADAAGNPLAEPAPRQFTVGDTTIPAAVGDSFVVRVNGAVLEVYRGALPPEPPTYSAALSDITTLNLTEGTYRFENDLAGLVLSATGSDPDNAIEIVFASSQHLGGLTLAGAVRAGLTPGADKLLRSFSGLSITGGASLDLADNDLIVQASPAEYDGALAALFNYIKSGRGGPDAPGLRSAQATALAGLGLLPNDKGNNQGPRHVLFAGEAVDTDAILVKYTWNGDANLDGVVNADDYFLVDTGFISQAGGYLNGDFNYDTVVNADDYFLIDSAFIGQTGPLGASLMVWQPATVPHIRLTGLDWLMEDGQEPLL